MKPLNDDTVCASDKQDKNAKVSSAKVKRRKKAGLLSPASIIDGLATVYKYFGITKQQL